MEKLRAQCVDNIHDLQKRVHTLELENTVLKAKVVNYEKEHTEVGEVLKSVQTWAGEASHTIEKLEDDRSYVMSRVHELEALDPFQLLALPNPGDVIDDVCSIPNSYSGDTSPFTCGSLTGSAKVSSTSDSPHGSFAAELGRASGRSSAEIVDSKLSMPVSSMFNTVHQSRSLTILTARGRSATIPQCSHNRRTTAPCNAR